MAQTPGTEPTLPFPDRNPGAGGRTPFGSGGAPWSGDEADSGGLGGWEDLTKDKLLLPAPRTTVKDRTCPSLGGVPLMYKIGQGGMGAVYFGIHPRLRTEVAVKVLPFHLAEREPGMVERFFREAQIAAHVQSPHLVHVMDVNEEHGLFFILMEYVNGLSAGRYLKDRKAQGLAGLPEAEALEIALAAAKGLAAAHARKVVHRDIKPDNILIPFGRTHNDLRFHDAKLSDLGLARSETAGQSLTGSNQVLGTPGYMSPEQATDAHRAGKPSDVFGLGAALYALLSGRAPFGGSGAFVVLQNTVSKPHEPVRLYRPDVTPGTAELLDKCLAKPPELRFADAGALCEALHSARAALVAGGGQALPPPTLNFPHPAPASGAATPLPATPAPSTPAPLAPSHAPVSTHAPLAAPSSLTPGSAVAAPQPKSRFAAVLALTLVVLALGALGGGYFWSKQRFEDHMADGKRAAQEGRYADAQDAFEQALGVPVFWEHGRARAALDETRAARDGAQREKDFEEAVADAKRAMASRNWSAAENYFHKAQLDRKRAGDARIAEGTAKIAAARRFEGLRERAKHLSDAQNWAEAAKVLSEALAVTGYESDDEASAALALAKDGQAYNAAMEDGEAAAKKGEWEDAGEAASKALEIKRYAQDAAARSLLKAAQNGISYDSFVAEARGKLDAADWLAAVSAFEQAATLAGMAESRVGPERQQGAIRGQQFAQAMAEGQKDFDAKEWKPAQAAFKRAGETKGYENHAQAAKARKLAQDGETYTAALERAQTALQKRAWDLAEASLKEARGLAAPFGMDPVTAGLETAANGRAYDKLMAAGRAGLDERRFKDAVQAYRGALDVKGYEEDEAARKGLADAQAGFDLKQKKEDYERALAQARALLKQVPPGDRELEAWGKVRDAAQAAVDSGHDDTTAAVALLEEARKNADAARVWLRSDTHLKQAEQHAANGRWEDANAELRAALAAVKRDEPAVRELRERIAVGLAKAQGRSFWQDDEKLLEYNGRTLVVGVRGAAAGTLPFVGVLQSTNTPVIFWVRIANQEHWMVFDKTEKKYLLFEASRNENTGNAAKQEKTEWVGEGKADGKRLEITKKMYRQFDKQNGGSGSLYQSRVSHTTTRRDDGQIKVNIPFVPTLDMRQTAREVPDEMAKKLVDAYAEKFKK
ncbi:MAG: protein kinase [Planctomycetes bacterium]|nr:protein kinase [Planctomycetota bacterium]